VNLFIVVTTEGTGRIASGWALAMTEKVEREKEKRGASPPLDAGIIYGITGRFSSIFRRLSVGIRKSSSVT